MICHANGPFDVAPSVSSSVPTGAVHKSEMFVYKPIEDAYTQYILAIIYTYIL